MNPFSIYFSGSPTLFLIGSILLIMIAISFIRGKSDIWKKYPLKLNVRMLITLLVFALFVSSNFNIGHKQEDLHRERFDTPMATSAPEAPQIRNKERPSTEDNFNKQLQKIEQENKK